MTDETEYHIAITCKSAGGRATIEWGGYALLHELLADMMTRAAEFGWLTEWPELPAAELMAKAELAARNRGAKHG